MSNIYHLRNPTYTNIFVILLQNYINKFRMSHCYDIESQFFFLEK